MVVDVTLSARLAGFDLLDSERVRERRVRVLVLNLPAHIGEREVCPAVRKLN